MNMKPPLSTATRWISSPAGIVALDFGRQRADALLDVGFGKQDVVVVMASAVYLDGRADLVGQRARVGQHLIGVQREHLAVAHQRPVR